jgi:hypothetical protein
MMRRLLVLLAALLVSACASVGPPAIHLSRGDLAQRAFIDRQQVDLNQLLKGMEGLVLRGPDVGVQMQAQRLQFGWTARLAEGPMGMPLSLYVALSGRPVLNAAGNGLDLADARIEEVRVPVLPFIAFDSRSFNESGEAMGTLPLLAFRPDELHRDGVIYQAGVLSLGTFGVRVALIPK